MLTQQKRSFKGVWIPSEIWLSKELTLQEKVFLVEIDSLDNEDGCYASNAYFAEFFQLSKNRCSEIIKNLESKGLISTRYIRKDGKKNIQKRVIKVVGKSNRGSRKIDRGIRETEQGYSEKCEENNTVFNNTSNKYSQDELDILSFWNTQNVVQHKQNKKGLQKEIQKSLKKYSKEKILKAIKRYSCIYYDKKYFYNHVWTLDKFLKQGNGVSNYFDDGQIYLNYLKWKKEQGNNDVDKQIDEETRKRIEKTLKAAEQEEKGA